MKAPAESGRLRTRSRRHCARAKSCVLFSTAHGEKSSDSRTKPAAHGLQQTGAANIVAARHPMARWSYMTLDHASFVDFARCLGERFRLFAGGEEICEVELASVTPLRSKSFGSAEAGGHESFRLL